MTERARLVRPARRYQASFIAAVREYIAEADEPSWHPAILRQRFDEFLATLQASETEPLAGMVPATHYWLVAPQDGYIGDLSLRHHLNDSLRRFGGHIGYRIRPSFRGLGYGRLICKLGIQKARARGISDILITCDEDNLASIRIIESNGGTTFDTVDNQRGPLTRRYWIRQKD